MDVAELWQRLTLAQRRLAAAGGLLVMGLAGWLCLGTAAENLPVPGSLPSAGAAAALPPPQPAGAASQRAVPAAGTNAPPRDPFAPPPEYHALPAAVSHASPAFPAAAAPQLVPPAPRAVSGSEAAVPAAEAEGTAEEPPVLSGLARGNGAPLALLRYGGRTQAYGVGEGPGAYRVTEIAAGTAKLEGPDGPVILSLRR